ncbi:hypothetical protein G7025_18840 [Pseudomonas lurida]|jgi:hypothetical protein|uniref:Uncharacterized protein n=1 Tax=Pseudomonas quebecensis TaxID=2995174 RepID=A0ABY6QDH6_9PSED|nr:MULTISPECIES: hypothetical protein [Pseudomonas]MBA1295421.1 hypothetical protein [Pseudomonas lurida]MCP1514547.1 hypothetical protein [Pseudomonas rhodesiae]MCX4063654.1 hypothetical protein [Pseudomonas quebecensis]MDF9768269.1 hypothetical protein [Pseudomonas rhodesiae]UZW17671.1 hypothetical protein OSC50_20100 [Pseudomonas quebecensis]
MTLAPPILKPQADKGRIRLAELPEALSLSITDKLALNSQVYAFILTDPIQDPEFPTWSGYDMRRLNTSEWRVSPDDPEDGDFFPLSDLKVTIPKETLANYLGKTIHVGYSTRGESGVESSSTIPLTITSRRTGMRTICHINSMTKLPGNVDNPQYFELEAAANVGDFIYFSLANLWVLVKGRYFFMGEDIDDQTLILETLVTEPPTDIRPPA